MIVTWCMFWCMQRAYDVALHNSLACALENVRMRDELGSAGERLVAAVEAARVEAAAGAAETSQQLHER